MINYFSLEEFLRSDTALSKKIENLPSFEVIEHIKEMLPILNDMRDSWGSGIRINSGFRSDKLNKAVGGVSTSSHKFGYAVDLQPVNGDIEGFKKFIIKWAADKTFDQCIIESKGKTQWIHFAYKNRLGEQRCKIFSLKA